MALKAAVTRGSSTATRLAATAPPMSGAAAPTLDRGQQDAIEITLSAGNVLADLGLPDDGDRMAKALLSRIIQDRVRELACTQRAAAARLGIATSDMSDLMRGKLARFSQERLERMLNALDLDVVIQVGPRPAWKERAGVSVTCVAGFTR